MHEQKCLSSFLFFRFQSFFNLRERERERIYIIGYKEKQSQNLLIFFSMDSCGEYFLFYGLFFYPEFLALVLPATNPVQQLTFLFNRLFFYPEFLALVPLATNPVQQLVFLFSFFSLTGRRCHYRFRVPANHLASTFFLPVSGDPSEVTKYKHLLVSTVTHILS